jgi:hypothetical protein
MMTPSGKIPRLGIFTFKQVPPALMPGRMARPAFLPQTSKVKAEQWMAMATAILWLIWGQMNTTRVRQWLLPGEEAVEGAAVLSAHLPWVSRHG